MNKNSTPQFGLGAHPRPYRCTVCKHETVIVTNHTDKCLNHCTNCSWKSEGFGPGVRMFGTLHREHEYVAEESTSEV